MTFDILSVVAVTSVVLVLFVCAYLVVLVSSHKRVLEAERVRIEETGKSAERYKALFDHSLAGMMKFSFDAWQIHESNTALFSILGDGVEKDMLSRFSDLPEAAKHAVRRKLMDDGLVTDYEIMLNNETGGKWILFSAKRLGVDNFAYGVVIDITKRKANEEIISKQAMLLNHAQDAIIVLNSEGLITYWNHAAELLYGWKTEEATGRSLKTLIYPDGKEDQYSLAFDDTRECSKWTGEQHHRIRSGKVIVADSRWNKVGLSSGDEWEILILNTDITHKKRMETQFVKAQKMESIALLTGGIAHDLQSLLSPVAMSVNLLKKEVTSETNLEVLRIVGENVRNGLNMLNNVLTYSRGASGERVDIDLVALVKQVVQMLHQSLPSAIRVHEITGRTQAMVRGDANQLKQAFLNIVSNAVMRCRRAAISPSISVK